MNYIKRALEVLGCVAALCLLMGTAGDVYRTIMTDTSGNVISTPISFSNNVVLNTTPASPAHLARYQDITNAPAVLGAITNITGNSTITVGGSGRTRTIGWAAPVTSTNQSFQIDIEQGRLLKTNSALSAWSTMVDWSGQGLLTTNNPALYNRTSLRWDTMRLYPVDGSAGGDTPSLDWYSRYLYGNWTALSNLTVNTLLSAYSLQIITNAGGASGTGRIAWNETDKTLEFGNTANVTLQIGQEQHLYARNSMGGGTTISNGNVVYISGATGSRASVKLANATNAATAHATIGIATENVVNGQNGFYSTFGLVRDVDTSAFTEGDQLYLGTTDGQLTNVTPTAPNHHVRIGTVVVKNASTGSIFVDVKDNGTIQELADVVFTPATGAGLIYTAGGFWTNATYGQLTVNNTWTMTNTFVNGTYTSNMTVYGNSEIRMPHYMAATTNTLTNPVTTNANVITWTDIAHTFRFRTVGSKIYADEVGTYEILASVLFKATTVEAVEGSLWFAVNGTNIPGSATAVSFPIATAGTVTNMTQVISVPIVANNMSTNDYLEVYWWGSDTSMILPHTAAAASPTRPSSPAAIITIKKISGGVDP